MVEPQPDKLVFLSYHKRNRAVADALARALKRALKSPLDKEHLMHDDAPQPVIEVWYDAHVEGGDRWDPLIQRKIGQADIILFLVTESSLGATYMWSEELPAAIERQREGARVIALHHGGVDAPILTHAATRGCHRVPSERADRIGERKWINQVVAAVKIAVQNALLQRPAPSGELAKALEAAREALTNTQGLFEGASTIQFGAVLASDIHRCLGGLEGAFIVTDPRQLARSIEYWRERASVYRVKLSLTLPEHARALADLVHAVEAVQAWAGEENARDTEQARRSAVAEASRVNQEIGDTRARLRAADTSLETLALAARPPTPLEADARQHFVIQGGKHVELAQLLLEEKAPDAGAVLEEVDALSREHVAYDAVVSELGANASDIARERRRDLAEAVGDAASSASALYARVLGNAAPGGDVREASLGYVETGCSDFDVCFGGLPRGAVTLLAARPAMGSTSLALGWARAIAKQAPVLYVTLDLDAEQIATRALAAEVEIEPHRIRRGEISEDEYAGLRDAALASQGLPLQFEADPDMSLDQLWERAQAIASGAEGLDLIVVDPVDRLNEGNVSENLAALAQMARALDTPVLAIATLSPSVERRRDKRPVLRDLSGRILRHTGMALMLYREEYYHLRREPAPGTEKHYFWQKKLEEAANRAELVAVKHPEHKTGGIQLMFSSKGPKFLELGD